MRTRKAPHAALSIAILIATLTATTPALAQVGSPKPNLEGPGKPVIRLSLTDSVTLGIENNINIEVQRHAPMIAEEDLAISWGAYDPTLSGNYTYTQVEGSEITAAAGGGLENIGTDGNVTRYYTFEG